MHLGFQRLSIRLLAAAALASCTLPAQKTEFTARVTGIQEGDILKIEHDGAAKKIRLWGIDCPEINQPYASQAKKFVSDLTLNQTVTFQVQEVDRYKRQVAFVILPDGRNLNHELVKAGLAWWFVRYAKQDTAIEKLEAEAKAAKRGLWAGANPTPPWEHRKRERGPM